MDLFYFIFIVIVVIFLLAGNLVMHKISPELYVDGKPKSTVIDACSFTCTQMPSFSCNYCDFYFDKFIFPCFYGWSMFVGVTAECKLSWRSSSIYSKCAATFSRFKSREKSIWGLHTICMKIYNISFSIIVTV